MAHTVESVKTDNNTNAMKYPSSSKFALKIDCICGGTYLPLIYNTVSNDNDKTYRCTKCGKDIIVRKVPIGRPV